MNIVQRSQGLPKAHDPQALAAQLRAAFVARVAAELSGDYEDLATRIVDADATEIAERMGIVIADASACAVCQRALAAVGIGSVELVPMSNALHLDSVTREIPQLRGKRYVCAPLCPVCTQIREAREEGRPTPFDWYAYLPDHEYMYVPTRETWPGVSVNKKLPGVAKEKGRMSTSDWLDKNRHVDQMVWAPGRPEVIYDHVVSAGGWTPHKGSHVFNLYRPPRTRPGCAALVEPWFDHVWRVYGEDAEHIIKWLAFKVQNPGRKINHALVLGGDQGIGKDTLLEPVKHAIGHWNFTEISPDNLLKPFNGFVKSVVLRVNEARDLGDFNRYSFYEHTKIYAAAPPDVLRCNEKYLREHYVENVCGLLLTTNNKEDGLYLPEDDRRHFVAWSNLTKESFSKEYWNQLWGWYEKDDGGCTGFDNVAAFLRELDLSDFDAKAPPEKTPAFWEIVEANRNPEEKELADVLDALSVTVPAKAKGEEARTERPAALTLGMIAARAPSDFGEWLADRKNRRAVPHRLASMGYVSVRKQGVKDGYWVFEGNRMAIYARKDLTRQEQYDAAVKLVKDFEAKALPKDIMLLVSQTPAQVLESRGISA